MSTKNLSEVYAHFYGRTDSLIREFIAITPQSPQYYVSCELIHQSGRMMTVIRSVHLWGEFCRSVVTRSALGNIRTANSQVLPAAPGISQASDVLTVARMESNNRPPPWHVSDFVIRVAQRLRVANYHTISQSVGAVSPIRDLIEIRNFIVHPNQRTQQRFQTIAFQYGSNSRNPIDLLNLTQPGGQSLFNLWVTQMQTLAAAAIQ